MPKQRWLPFDYHERLDVLWERFPPEKRREAIRQYAGLVVRAAGSYLQRIDGEVTLTREIANDSGDNQ